MRKNWRIPKYLLLLVGAALALPAGAREDEILRPEEAFRAVVSDGGDALRVAWTIADGYYLYRDKLSFESATPAVRLGAAELPEGRRHEDEFFGVQQVYRERAVVTIPYTLAGPRPDAMQLVLRSQGCADIGICYPPQAWPVDVELAAADAASGGRPGLATVFGARRGAGDFLPVDDAFRPHLIALDGNTLELSWQVADGYYLYRDKITAQTASDRVQLGRLQLPPGEPQTDEYFGTTEVYFDEVFATLPVARATPEPLGLELEVSYQGCAVDGICYPPVTRTLGVQLPEASAAGALATAGGDAPTVSEQTRLAVLIRDAGIGLIAATFFGAGLLLAFTPCVLPMIPILSGIIAGDGDGAGPARGFMLAASYVMGMALVYTAAGIAAAAIGVQLQAVFNAPWVVSLFAALFVVLALGMFGLYELRMPVAVQERLAALSGRQRSGTVIGAFAMGALSSLIVTACVAPPLVAALTVIGQSGDLARGGIALFALSLGMGAPLLVVGASAGRLLPRAGPWTVAVRNGFGFVMLGLAVWMLGRILPPGLTLALWGVLALMAGVFLGGLTALEAGTGMPRKLAKGSGVLAVIYGAALFIGALAGGQDPLKPLAALGAGAGGGNTAAVHGLDFQRVKTVDDLDRALARAAANGQGAMLDFYADWCVSCIEMERYTFTDPAVQAALADAVLLQADVTANDAEDRALLERFGVFGPPTIIFFDSDGRQRQGYEIVGYMAAAAFAEHVERALGGSGAAKLTALTGDAEP